MASLEEMRYFWRRNLGRLLRTRRRRKWTRTMGRQMGREGLAGRPCLLELAGTIVQILLEGLRPWSLFAL